MSVDQIRKFCLTFPGAKEKLQWGDNLCFKVGGKIFAIISLDDPRLCFKCAPETFSELIERENIRPAPYLGRYRWAMLERLDALAWNELRELISNSHAMVAAKALGGRAKSGKKSAGKKPAKTARKIQKKRR
jgi:predicted DNA-binding protein (MmcQ/YjbR family)